MPLDEEKIVVESWKDIVLRFNGDPYRGRSRSVPSQKRYKSGKCWTLENVSFLLYFEIIFALLVIKVRNKDIF